MSSKSNKMSVVWIVLCLLSMLLAGYLWFQLSEEKAKNQSLSSEAIEMEKLHTQLDQEYKSALQDLEALRGDNQELNTLIDNQKTDLASQKKRISGLIWTERELGKAREELAQMQMVANQYVSEINTLKNKNQVLTTKNTELTETNTELSDEIVVNKKRINSLDSVQTVLVGQTEELTENNTMLSSKVDMAEAIKINFIEVKGYDVKDDGSVKEKGKAKKVEMLRACFKTETNLVVPAGEEEFFITYVSPAGSILYVEELGSGMLSNKLDGKDVKYTASGSISYNNEDTEACLDWKPNFALNKGTYTVHIYNNGFNVGNGEFKLK